MVKTIVIKQFAWRRLVLMIAISILAMQVIVAQSATGTDLRGKWVLSGELAQGSVTISKRGNPVVGIGSKGGVTLRGTLNGRVFTGRIWAKATGVSKHCKGGWSRVELKLSGDKKQLVGRWQGFSTAAKTVGEPSCVGFR